MHGRNTAYTSLALWGLVLLMASVLTACGGGGNGSGGGGGGGVTASITWAKTFGGTSNAWALSVQQTSDGGYIAVGPATITAAFAIKLDSSGNVQWQKTFDGVFFETVQQTSDGGYIVAGGTEGSGLSDAQVIKLDASGGILWQKTYGGAGLDWAMAAQQTSDNGYVVAGHTGSSGAGGLDAWVLKLDSGGNVLWQKTYGGSYDDDAGSVQQTSDGGYIVAGSSASFGTPGVSDAWVFKLDPGGNVLWQKTYGGTLHGYLTLIQQTSDGGYVTAGGTSASAGDAWVLKLDSGGNIQWQRSYGAAGNDYAYAIQQTSDSGYIVAGGTDSSGAGGQDAWAFKLDSGGNIQWQKSYGGSGDDWAFAVQQTSDGGYIAAGGTYSFGAGGESVWVMKLDANGNISASCQPGLGSATSAVSAAASAVPANSYAAPANTATAAATTNIIPQGLSSSVAAQCSYP